MIDKKRVKIIEKQRENKYKILTKRYLFIQI